MLDPVKLAKLQQQPTNRIGGPGTPRRKSVRPPTKRAHQLDDKRLHAALKRLNVQPIQGVEEVNMFREDGNVLHFNMPKVHAALSSNVFVIYGVGQVKELTELVPGILNQLGHDSLASLRKLAESYQAIQQQGQQRPTTQQARDDDDDVPDLVESFDLEAESKEKLEALN